MKTIAVIFGGQSTEHDVSIVTALASVIKPLELSKKYKVEPVYIAKDGSWYWNEKLKDINLFQSGEIEDLLRKEPKAQILFDKGLKLVKKKGLSGHKQISVDIAFPATHGTHGEDGELMGILEMANVAYVGCNVAASAIAMDKVLAKQIAKAENIASTPWVWFYAKDLVANSKKIIEDVCRLKFPLFVKPAHLGSSIGISKVDSETELINALEVAAHYDDKVIVEEAVSNLIEVTLPIIGNDKPRPALLEMPLTKSEDFFDFDTKYIRGGGKKGKGKAGAQGYSKLPAPLDKELYAQAEQLGLDVYKALGCSGIARVDMLIDSKVGKVFFNEVNPLPGSLYAHNWRAAGLSSVDLVCELVQLAEEKWQAKQKLITSFPTSYLKQF